MVNDWVVFNITWIICLIVLVVTIILSLLNDTVNSANSEEGIKKREEMYAYAKTICYGFITILLAYYIFSNGKPDYINLAVLVISSFELLSNIQIIRRIYSTRKKKKNKLR